MSSKSADTSAYERALQEFNRINIPAVQDQELNFLTPEYLGDYASQQEAAINMDPSAMEGISTDPRLQAAQMDALEQISQMGETGFTPAEQAALREARRDAAGEAQAKSSQLLSEFARRGMGGSGAELAARLQAGQSSADRLSQEGDRLAQMSQERALNAIAQKATLGGQIRSQEFGEQSDVARAQDAINQFNTANKQNVQQRNISNTNQANLRNLSEKQRLGESGTGIKNQQQQYNKQLLQQQFNNQMQMAGAKAGQYQQLANAQQQAAANEGQMMGNVLGAAGTVVGAVYGGPAGAAAGGAVGSAAGKQVSDETAKEQIKPFDASKFLDSISGYEFHYKEPKKHGKGKQVGVMAQDVEKEVPQMVNEREDGLKELDYSKAGGPIFASLAEMHERLKKLEG